jgi:hypothetical protein
MNRSYHNGAAITGWQCSPPTESARKGFRPPFPANLLTEWASRMWRRDGLFI